jgi:ZIP family zinc transporter
MEPSGRNQWQSGAKGRALKRLIQSNCMWAAIAVVSGLASVVGYGLFQNSPPDTVAFVLPFAGGAILTMLADTMMPEAYEDGGKLVGVVTTLGFAVALLIHTLD